MIALPAKRPELNADFFTADTLPAPPPDDECEVEESRCWACDGTKSVRTADASYADPGDWRECPHCGDSAT